MYVIMHNLNILVYDYYMYDKRLDEGCDNTSAITWYHLDNWHIGCQ